MKVAFPTAPDPEASKAEQARLLFAGPVDFVKGVVHMDGLPPCIILYGEYDFLRVECESYARKLQKAGVEVKAVRYRGLSHGFADVIGKYPQAEDCMDEVGKFMMAHLGA